LVRPLPTAWMDRERNFIVMREEGWKLVRSVIERKIIRRVAVESQVHLYVQPQE
jgi:hypothetical protein